MVRRSEPPLEPGFTRLPELVEPMLASPGTLPADDEDWSYEFKWDGVRALARVEGGRLRLHSRKGNDITVTYPELRPLGEELGSTQVWLDGEIVAMQDGRPSFPALQQRMHVQNDRQARSLANSVPVTYLVFDVLYLDGTSCVDLPYEERRELLAGLELRGPNWNISPSFDGDGAAVVETAREQELEGVIAKRRSSRYYPGRRTADWVKITEVLTIEVLIGGWRPGEGRRDRHDRLADAGRADRRGPAVRRPGRHRLHRRGAGGSARAAETVGAEGVPVRQRGAEGPREGRDVVVAGGGRRGRVPQLDAGRPAARAVVAGVAVGQGRGGPGAGGRAETRGGRRAAVEAGECRRSRSRRTCWWRWKAQRLRLSNLDKVLYPDARSARRR